MEKADNFGLKIDDDSMFPRFLPGDIAIVDPAIRCEDGEPCAVLTKDAVLIRLPWDKESEFVLKPTNDKYPSMTIKKGRRMNFRVWGKVVGIERVF